MWHLYNTSELYCHSWSPNATLLFMPCSIILKWQVYSIAIINFMDMHGIGSLLANWVTWSRNILHFLELVCLSARSKNLLIPPPTLFVTFIVLFSSHQHLHVLILLSSGFCVILVTMHATCSAHTILHRMIMLKFDDCQERVVFLLGGWASGWNLVTAYSWCVWPHGQRLILMHIHQ